MSSICGRAATDIVLCCFGPGIPVTEYNPGARVVEMLNSVSVCESLNRPVNKTGNARGILCVDDEPAVLHTTALILRHAGYYAVTATNAEDSLHLLNSQSFDLLLLDGIPERESVIQEARRVHPGVRIALNVGNPDLGDFSQLNVDMIIQKPILPSVFLAKIQELLGPEPDCVAFNATQSLH